MLIEQMQLIEDFRLRENTARTLVIRIATFDVDALRISIQVGTTDVIAKPATIDLLSFAQLLDMTFAIEAQQSQNLIILHASPCCIDGQQHR